MTRLGCRKPILSFGISMLNAIGLGLGPLTIGIISDYLEPTLGTDALRWHFQSHL